MIRPSASCTTPMASNTSCLCGSHTGGSAARPSRKNSQSTSIQVMRLGFSSLMQGATYGPYSSAVYLAPHPERQRTSFRTRPWATQLSGISSLCPRAPGTIAGPMLISFTQDSLDFHSSLNGPFTGSLPALTLMLSRLRGRAVRQTSHDLTKSGTFCVARHAAHLTDPTLTNTGPAATGRTTN
jgi:hypothetical protein